MNTQTKLKFVDLLAEMKTLAINPATRILVDLYNTQYLHEPFFPDITALAELNDMEEYEVTMHLDSLVEGDFLGKRSDNSYLLIDKKLVCTVRSREGHSLDIGMWPRKRKI